MKNWILGVDTCTENLGIALFCPEDDACFSFSELMPKQQAGEIHPKIDELLKKAGVTPKELTLVCATKGPGSYTGIRVGLCTVKGFGLALDIPVCGLTTLEVLAWPHLNQGRGVTAFLKAHGGDVYLQNFDENGKALAEPKALKTEEAVEEIPEGNLVVGTGVQAYKGLLDENVGVDADTPYPNPEVLVRRTWELWQKGEKNHLKDEPIYVHPLTYRKLNER